MSGASALPLVSAALAEDGFEASLLGRGVTYRGTVDVNGLAVQLRLEFRDLEFSEPAYAFIENPCDLPRRVLPHLDEKNELCVVDRNAFVADRYAAAAQARGLVCRAREIITHGLTRHAVDDIANEFPQYWAPAGAGIDFGDYEGPTQTGSNAGGYLLIQRSNGKTAATGWSLRTQTRLSFRDDQARPETFGELLTWAGSWDANLPDRILAALGKLSANDPHCLIIAPNGLIVFWLQVSARGREQVAALSRPAGWQRALHTPFAAALPIRRDRGFRADVDYALGRNGGGMAPLSKRKIVLVGCGSIGGFLARSLAQLGAGRDGGMLILIDDDSLAATNVGRHLLGMGDVGRSKVDACRDQILRDLPGGKVLARKFKVQSQRHLFTGADLVIDATGEQGVSEMLNDWMLEARSKGTEFPDLLHVSIEGAGAAVQSFISSDAAFGCIRCLRPNHAERSRFSPLKDEMDVTVLGGCGEAAFTPYGPAAPMMAAALAAQHATDWANGQPRHLLRTGRLDWANTKEVKPVNPTKSDHCPACHPS